MLVRQSCSALLQRAPASYREMPAGGRVDITTSDPAALAAVHDFLKYQITEHQTGDAKTVSRRTSGN